MLIACTSVETLTTMVTLPFRAAKLLGPVVGARGIRNVCSFDVAWRISSCYMPS